MADVLVCGDILLASADAPPLPRGGVLLRDGAVAEVGEREALTRAHPGAQIIGGAGKLVLPGLVNAHHHGMGISTVQLGYPDPGPPEPGLRDTPFESWMGTMLGLDAIDPYLGTLCKDVLLIESGVTAHLHMHFPSGAGEGQKSPLALRISSKTSTSPLIHRITLSGSPRIKFYSKENAPTLAKLIFKLLQHSIATL